MTYIYIHGRGGPYDIPVGGQNYTFSVPMPPKPSNFPTQVQLRYHVIDLPFGGPAPTLSTNIQGNNALVVYPLTSFPASADNKFGAIVAAKWINPFLQTPTQGFRTLKVTFDSITINEDHDSISAEWDNLWVGVNGKWIELSGPLGHYGLHDADNGEQFTFPAGGKSVTVIVPETGELKIKTTGWEDDNDGYYGEKLVDCYFGGCSIPIGALNDNDKIGFVSSVHTAADNFAWR
ncbi:MAG: hypothetical protein WBV84_15185 [Nitrososphaeraceae archaeon]